MLRAFISFLFVLSISACASPPPVLDGELWVCEHKYWSESVSFRNGDLTIVEIRQCPSIIRRGGECPTYIKIVTVKDEIFWATSDEWVNYDCQYLKGTDE